MHNLEALAKLVPAAADITHFKKASAVCGCMQEKHAMLLFQKANRQPGQDMVSSCFYCVLALCVIARISMSSLSNIWRLQQVVRKAQKCCCCL